MFFISKDKLQSCMRQSGVQYSKQKIIYYVGFFFQIFKLPGNLRLYIPRSASFNSVSSMLSDCHLIASRLSEYLLTSIRYQYLSLLIKLCTGTAWHHEFLCSVVKATISFLYSHSFVSLFLAVKQSHRIDQTRLADQSSVKKRGLRADEDKIIILE